jgi:hypothetical protein
MSSQSAREARGAMDGEAMKEVARELELSQAEVGLLLGGYDQSTVSGWFRTGKAPEVIKHIFASPTCRKHFFIDKAMLAGRIK